MAVQVCIPTAFLYTNGNQESEEARELLASLGVNFEEANFDKDFLFKDDGFKLPVLRSLEGEYIGLERIKGYIDLISNRP